MSFQLARRTERMSPSVIREILKLTEQPGIISLAGGLPFVQDGVFTDTRLQGNPLAGLH